MSAVQATNSRYPEIHSDIAATLPGQNLAWLQSLRSDALAKFSSQGFPTSRAEEWRYTNISAIEKHLFKPVAPEHSHDIDSAWLAQHRLQDSWTLVLVDGRFDAGLSNLDDLPEGVSLLSMADALEQCPDKVSEHLGQAVSDEDNSFIDFNSAWFSDGLWLSVAANTVLAKPIQLLHIVSQADALACSRNLIVTEANVEVSVVENFVCVNDERYFTAAVNEVFVGENSHVKLYKLQTESAKAIHFGGNYSQQQTSGRFTHHSFSFGALIARNEVHGYLGQASECDFNGLYLGKKTQHVDNHTRIFHQLPHAISRETYKGILDQRARGVFQGRVIVAEDAQKTDSEMHNHNLLLSDFAEADTKPQLEIYADDVKCAHGVTVGQLDEKSVFYLQSRCVDTATARAMLTFAFANEMVDKVDLDSFKALVLKQLLQYFPQTDIEEEWL